MNQFAHWATAQFAASIGVARSDSNTTSAKCTSDASAAPAGLPRRQAGGASTASARELGAAVIVLRDEANGGGDGGGAATAADAGSAALARRHGRANDSESVLALMRAAPTGILDSLNACKQLYWNIHVAGAPPRTARAKHQDLDRFEDVFAREVMSDRVDDWTPSVSKAFMRELEESPSDKTGEPLKAATRRRVYATLRHFARWLMKERPLLAGYPLAGVSPPFVSSGAFKGLTQRQVMRLRSELDKRLNQSKRRKNQEPRQEAAIFFLLLHTGLREHELCRLDLAQYHHRGLHQVRRKGAKVTNKVPVPTEAREALGLYIDQVRGREPGPLIQSRYKKRMTERAVALLCERLARDASAQLPAAEQFHVTPHQLRHTFLKRIADKEGVHAAQEMSGNISVQEIFRFVSAGVVYEGCLGRWSAESA